MSRELEIVFKSGTSSTFKFSKHKIELNPEVLKISVKSTSEIKKFYYEEIENLQINDYFDIMEKQKITTF